MLVRKPQITHYATSKNSQFCFYGPFTRDQPIDYAGRIVPYLDDQRTLSLDFTNVTQIDTTFIGGVIRIIQAVKENRLVRKSHPIEILVKPTPEIDRWFDMYRIENIMKKHHVTIIQPNLEKISKNEQTNYSR